MKKLISLVLTVSLLSQSLTIPVFSKNPSSTFHPQNLSSTIYPLSSNYIYDSSGNLISDGEQTISYDASGMPSSITKGNTVVNFIYDGSGQRIGKIVKVDSKLQSSTIYFGSIEKEMAYNTSGEVTSTIVTKYYFAGSKRIALRKDNGDPVYLHKDHLSSSTLFTNKDGNKVDSLITYYPYGTERSNWDIQASTLNPPPSNHLYTNQIKDPETDLYYYNARYYNPQIGMFISPDSLPDKFTADNLTGKLNRYSYVKNNPVRFNDPLGHTEIPPELGGGSNNPPNPPQPPEPDNSPLFSDPVIRSRMEWWFYNVAQASVALGLDFRKPSPSTPEEKRKLLRDMTDSLKKHGINVVSNPLISNLMLNFFCSGECPAIYHPLSNTITIRNENDTKDAELNITLAALFHETFHYYQFNTGFSPQLGVAYGIPEIKALQELYIPGEMELIEAEDYANEIFIVPRLTGEKSALTYEDMKKYIGKDPASYYWLFSEEAQQKLMTEYILPYLYFEY